LTLQFSQKIECFSPISTDMENETINVKILLFARWIAMNYGTPEYNVNGMDGEWWKKTLKYFNSEVYPTMILNGSVENTEKFLKE